MKRILFILWLAAVVCCCKPKTGAPFLSAYTDSSNGPVCIYSAPGGDVLLTLSDKYDFTVQLTDPADGWWRVLSPLSLMGVPDEEDEDLLDIDIEGWISAKSVSFMSFLRHTMPTVARKNPSETAPEAFSIPLEEVWTLYPLDARGDWVLVSPDPDLGLSGWIQRDEICLDYFGVCDEFHDSEQYEEDEEEEE